MSKPNSPSTRGALRQARAANGKTTKGYSRIALERRAVARDIAPSELIRRRMEAIDLTRIAEKAVAR